MNTSSIYVITAITGVDSSNPFNLRLGNTRCVGWFPTFDAAEHAVLSDIFKEHEDEYCKYYHWFVIEELAPGCCNEALARFWYHWDADAKSFKAIADFQDLEIYPNIGIG